MCSTTHACIYHIQRLHLCLFKQPPNPIDGVVDECMRFLHLWPISPEHMPKTTVDIKFCLSAILIVQYTLIDESMIA